MNVYTSQAADLSVVKGKTIAVIGYGSQGRAQSNNMRDSELNVVIGAGPKELYSDWVAAERGDFKVYPIEEAAKAGDIVHLLLPDPVQPKVYWERSIQT